jgi:hypothetical protein
MGRARSLPIQRSLSGLRDPLPTFGQRRAAKGDRGDQHDEHHHRRERLESVRREGLVGMTAFSGAKDCATSGVKDW